MDPTIGSPDGPGGLELVDAHDVTLNSWKITIAIAKAERLLFTNSKIIVDKHNAELQRADPGTKFTGQFSTRGRIFPHNAQNGFSLFP